MIVYAIIMFVVALIFLVTAVQIGKGNTKLIHDYHQKKVTDQAAYGKAFGKALGMIPAALILSGIIALFGEAVAMVAVCVLVAGLIAGIIAIVRVQRKYNGGVF